MFRAEFDRIGDIEIDSPYDFKKVVSGIEITMDELSTRLYNLKNGIIPERDESKPNFLDDIYASRIDDNDDISIGLHKLKFSHKYRLLEEPPEYDMITTLPREIISHIAGYFGYIDLVHLYMTCKKLYSLLLPITFHQTVQIYITYLILIKGKKNRDIKKSLLALNKRYTELQITGYNSEKDSRIRFGFVSHILHSVITICDYNFEAGTCVEYLKAFFTHGLFSKSIDNDVKLLKIFFLECILEKLNNVNHDTIQITCGSNKPRDPTQCNCPLLISRIMAYNLVEWFANDPQILKYMDGMYLKTQNKKYYIEYIMFRKTLDSWWSKINIFNL